MSTTWNAILGKLDAVQTSLASLRHNEAEAVALRLGRSFSVIR